MVHLPTLIQLIIHSGDLDSDDFDRFSLLLEVHLNVIDLLTAWCWLGALIASCLREKPCLSVRRHRIACHSILEHLPALEMR